MTYDQSLTQAYRNTFNTAHGQHVLQDMLVELGFFATNLSGPGQEALRNFAAMLMLKTGCLDPVRANEVVGAITKGLMSIPIKDKEESHD